MEEASVGRKTTDREAAVLSAVGKWSASKVRSLTLVDMHAWLII